MLKHISIFVALCLAAGCAGNDTTSDNNGQNDAESVQAASNLSITDRQFIHDATVGGMTEVQTGQIAANRGTNGDLKQFGQQMVTDHQRANAELAQLAQQKGVTVPTYPDTDGQNVIDKLNSLNGADFDDTYIAGQVKSHTDTIRLFENEANNGQDSDLKSFASRTLPTLQHHLEMIKSLQSSIGTAGSRDLNKRGPETPNSPIVPPDQPAGNNQIPPEQPNPQK
jgi:putative membrane protein